MWDKLLLAGMKVVGQIMARFPDYEEEKVEKFHAIRTQLEKEIIKPYGIRNDKLVLDLSDQLRIYVEDFSKILCKSSLASVRKN